MLLVGLTGGIGAGKSTVSEMLARKGALIVDADELARRALEPGSTGYEKVVETFGEQVLAPDGGIDRQLLGREVFADPERRLALESIIHPEVFRLLAEEVETLRGTNAIVVFDAPLIVETGFHRSCDIVVVVTAPDGVRVDRVMRHRGMTRDEALARIAAQAGSDERAAAADLIVDNAGGFGELESAVDSLWDELKRAESAQPPDR